MYKISFSSVPENPCSQEDLKFNAFASISALVAAAAAASGFNNQSDEEEEEEAEDEPDEDSGGEEAGSSHDRTSGSATDKKDSLVGGAQQYPHQCSLCPKSFSSAR